MGTSQLLISGILVITMLSFVWGRWRYDLVAMSALMACVLAGLVDAENAFAGFGHPAVVTVAAVLIISSALRDAGVVDEEDILILRANPDDLKAFLNKHGLELRSTASPTFIQPSPDNEIMAEGVVRNDSPLVGKGVEFIRRQTGRTLALVGLARQGRPVTQRLRQQVFRKGDVLLLHGDNDSVDQQFGILGLWPLMRRPINLNRTRKIALASGIFGIAILTGIAGLVSLPIAFVLAVGAYVLTGILTVRRIYDDIDWPVIVLLAAMIPVGNALTSTGTTQLVAESLISVTEGLSVSLILGLLLVVTMLLSDVINNAATALVMAPLSIAMAEALQVNVDPFLMAVAVGASCAFLTPIGHQCNTLVMGPGGYKFSDYWRVGLPLEIVIVVISVPTILWVWPL